MAVGKGATSLVELILKKFAGDTAGAAKELERLGGFPESVSQRIASGELPMDSGALPLGADFLRTPKAFTAVPTTSRILTGAPRA